LGHVDRSNGDTDGGTIGAKGNQSGGFGLREHKYRAWYKHTKEMLEVSEIKLLTSPYMHLKLTGKSPIHYFGVGDNVELMQFTGLKDCKGKEIYEGDIVQTTYNWKTNQSKAQVVIEHLTCGIRWLSPQDPSDFGFKPLYDPSNDADGTGELWWDLSKFEIIGNIYENKDLLA